MVAPFQKDYNSLKPSFLFHLLPLDYHTNLWREHWQWKVSWFFKVSRGVSPCMEGRLVECSYAFDNNSPNERRKHKRGEYRVFYCQQWLWRNTARSHESKNTTSILDCKLHLTLDIRGNLMFPLTGACLTERGWWLMIPFVQYNKIINFYFNFFFPSSIIHQHIVAIIIIIIIDHQSSASEDNRRRWYQQVVADARKLIRPLLLAPSATIIRVVVRQKKINSCFLLVVVDSVQLLLLCSSSRC